MSTHKITLEEGEFETTRRAMLKAAAVDLKIAAEQMDELATCAPWPIHTRSSDTQTLLKAVRESLAILDALGWPADAGRD